MAKNFKLTVSQLAKEDIETLRKFEQRQVVDAIEEHLKSQPTKVSKSRIKKMVQPFWSDYRLRVGDYRIYYDVNQKTHEVNILRVIEKGQQPTPTDKKS